MAYVVVTIAGVSEGNMGRLYEPRDYMGNYCNLNAAQKNGDLGDPMSFCVLYGGTTHMPPVSRTYIYIWYGMMYIYIYCLYRT